jgi:hypothetical protein
MKTRNIFLLALTAIFAASCHMWDEPSVKDGLESFGNKYLQESNVVTVKELKDAFKTEITGGTLKQVTKATQIKVIVTGNDEGSNIYKTLYVADKTGGISISIIKRITNLQTGESTEELVAENNAIMMYNPTLKE